MILWVKLIPKTIWWTEATSFVFRSWVANGSGRFLFLDLDLNPYFSPAQGEVVGCGNTWLELIAGNQSVEK